MRWELNSDDWDEIWISLTIALEAEKCWIVTLLVHDHIQYHSNPLPWNEMRGREEWVVGGVEWRSGRWWWWLLLCIVPLCVSFVFSIEVSVHYNACLTWMQWVVLVSLLCYYVYSSACDVVLVLLYLVFFATMKIEFSSTWFACLVSWRVCYH